MGLKIRLGLAGVGLIMSYFFGLSGLTGIATHLDSTGNILVDIADGIGLVSKGIEALETWVDPNSEPTQSEPPVPISSENQDPPSVTNPTPVPVDPEPAVKPVICKKGKCQPYDPAKDRVLQQQLIKAERERILQQIKSGALPSAEASHLLEELDEDDISPALAKKLRSAQKQQQQATKTASATTNVGDPAQQSSSTSPSSESASSKIEILDPSDPQLNLDESADDSQQVNSDGWRFGAKRILRSVVNVCQRINQLILKTVARVFPWNRRAKRRLRAPGQESEDDEL